MSGDRFALARFVDAQARSFEAALAELRAGAKRSHWMWYVFPQVAGLGSSAMAHRYAIGSLDEARAYLAHPILGDRLRQCITTMAPHAAKGAEAVFGAIDALKLRSSLTLFSGAGEPLAAAALEDWFAGNPDEATLAILRHR